jgi:hypothetical protein
MAKSRRYSKKGRKTMRKKNGLRRKKTRGGAAQLPQSERIYPIVTSNVPYSN